MRRIAALVLAAASGCATVISNEPVTLALGTATPGGGFQVYGAAYAQAIHEADPTITLEQRPTKGSNENIPLLDEGKVDLALVAGEPAQEALAGIGRAPAKMKVVTAMYPTAGMFVVRADSPYRTIHDLKGKSVAFGARASGFVVQAGYVLDALGLDRERDFQAVYLERAGDGSAMLKDGRVAAVWGGGIGYPVFMEAAKLPGGVRFIAPNAAEVKLIVAKHPFMKPATVPAGSFPGQTEAIASIGSWSFVYARANLPDDAAYRVIRALHRAVARLGATLAQAQDSTAANTYAAVADPALIHPGALRYLREAGIAK